ncbi:MAG: cadherin-like beta sandwich domain-containing protein, partial [Bacilli bacterium]|nr:cadherin-like beta sandwich domain-containing protein [Bacilli bacterium]
MNRIKKLLIAVILSLGILPSIVSAATANFSISAPSQGIVGNNITVTVTISSSTSLGSWEMALSYDKSYLQLSSAPEGANGTKVADTHKSAGNKTKTYTYKFKVLKSGTTTISTTSTDAYDWDFNVLSCSNGSKKITLKTQAEIEASYSSDAYLKSLGVTGYTLTPEFDKKVNEYSLEVENDVEKVTITGAKNDSNATVSGLGEKELKEGTNKFNIVVTAQKGNSLTYVVSVTRKELNPIEVNVKGKKYFVVRKKADVPEVTMFTDTTAVYGEDEIPALYNEALNYTLIALKDEEGNIKPFIYKDGKVEDEYIVITTNTTTIIPIGINEEKSKLKV